MIIDKGDVLLTEGNKGERHTLQRYNKCRALRQAQGPSPKKNSRGLRQAQSPRVLYYSQV